MADSGRVSWREDKTADYSSAIECAGAGGKRTSSVFPERRSLHRRELALNKSFEYAIVVCGDDPIEMAAGLRKVGQGASGRHIVCDVVDELCRQLRQHTLGDCWFAH